MSDKWHVRFLQLAHQIASWSKDRSTKVGAVLVRPDRTPAPYGYNGFPRQVDDDIDDRHSRPDKYDWTEHAERNAIYNAARIGVALEDCTIYVTHFPCVDCSRAIIQVGMKRVVVDEASLGGDFGNRWADGRDVSKQMFEEAGVEIVIVPLNGISGGGAAEDA
ncbi:MAG: dCMP deaminase family protein [Rhodospirillales bacterium]|nr:dCMP deaminase family protein [Rhodospirillales bacterium]MCW9001231.1 dCMP deaminase family protein [Rhodospirillales bacterium]